MRILPNTLKSLVVDAVVLADSPREAARNLVQVSTNIVMLLEGGNEASLYEHLMAHDARIEPGTRRVNMGSYDQAWRDMADDVRKGQGVIFGLIDIAEVIILS